MTRNANRTLAGLIAATLAASAAHAQLAIDWHSIDGGGGTSFAGDFTLSGTIGQPDAGTLIGGDFVLIGGFHAAAAPFCIGDVTGDSQVSLTDLAILLSNFGTVGDVDLSDGDLNNDDRVNLTDLATLLANFGTSCA